MFVLITSPAQALAGAILSLAISENEIIVKISSPEIAVNAVRTIVIFDPTAVKILGIKTINSFCDQNLFIEKIIDNGQGRVIVSCGLPTPGFVGQGRVVELVYERLQPKSFELNLMESQVLANDGLGTDVLLGASGARYIYRELDEKKLAPQPPAERLKYLLIDYFQPTLQNSKYLV